MKNSSNILPWLAGGIFLGVVFLMAVVLVKPIGVSTQFVIFDAIVWDAVQPDVIQKTEDGKYTSSNAYLAKSHGKYAKSAANPWNYSFVFVLAMAFGAWLSSRLKGDKPTAAETQMPQVWRDRFGDSTMKRYLAAFVAGFLVLYGARLAGGCTSGHMMSGMMQTAVSGYLFSLGLFATSLPLGIWLYNRKK